MHSLPASGVAAPAVSSSGKPAAAVAGNAALTGRRSKSGKLPRNAGHDQLASSRGRVSMCPPTAASSATLVVPPISAYASGKPAVAVAGKAVVIGKAMAKTRSIPNNFSSNSGYLKV